MAFTNCLTRFSSRTDSRLLDSLATKEWNNSDLLKDAALCRQSDTGNSLSTKIQIKKIYYEKTTQKYLLTIRSAG